MQPERSRSAPPAAVLPAVPADIKIDDEVTVSQLAQLLSADVGKIEDSLAELGEAPGSTEDRVSYTNAELVAMAFGRTVTFSKDVLVRPNAASCVDINPCRLLHLARTHGCI